MNSSSVVSLIATSALVFSDSNYTPPPFVSFWIFLLVNTLFKVFLTVAVVVTEFTTLAPPIILVVHILLFRLWHQLLGKKFYTVAMLTMVAIFATNTLYMILAFSIYFVPYAGWCIALLVWNVYSGKEEEEPILPQKAAVTPLPMTAVPPRIRLFAPPSPPRKK